MKKEYIIKYATIHQPLSEDEYKNSKKDLSEEEISERYYTVNDDGEVIHYEKNIPSTNDEIYTALLYQLCKKQDETNIILKAIKGMLIFFTVLTVISLCIGIYAALEIM